MQEVGQLMRSSHRLDPTHVYKERMSGKKAGQPYEANEGREVS